MTEFSLSEAPPIVARVIFCEDARMEASGQFSLIGVFPVGLIAPTFPYVITKLAMMVEISTALDLESEDMSVRGYLPAAAADQPFWEAKLSQAALVRTPERIAVGPYPAGKVNRHILLAIHTNLLIIEPGDIRVRLFRRSEYLPVGALAIMTAEEAAPLSAG